MNITARESLLVSRGIRAEADDFVLSTLPYRYRLLQFGTGCFESNIPYQSVHTIKEAANVLVEGGKVYKWELPVFIPSNAPPHEQSRNGRVHWTAQAYMTFPGRFFNKTLEAVTVGTALDLGISGGASIRAHSSYFLLPAQTICVAQIPPEHSTFSFEHQHDAFAEGLGVSIPVDIKSQRVHADYSPMRYNLPAYPSGICQPDICRWRVSTWRPFTHLTGAKAQATLCHARAGPNHKAHLSQARRSRRDPATRAPQVYDTQR